MKKFKCYVCSSLYTIWKGAELDWDAMIPNCHSFTMDAISESSVLNSAKQVHPCCVFKIIQL